MDALGWIVQLRHTASVTALSGLGCQQVRCLVQSLHTDVDHFLLDLDTNFGVLELMDDAELAGAAGPARVQLAAQPLPALANMSNAELTREAAAMATAATRYKLEAEHAACNAERARADMQTLRRDSLRTAECASRDAACLCLTPCAGTL